MVSTRRIVHRRCTDGSGRRRPPRSRPARHAALPTRFMRRGKPGQRPLGAVRTEDLPHGELLPNAARPYIPGIPDMLLPPEPEPVPLEPDLVPDEEDVPLDMAIILPAGVTAFHVPFLPWPFMSPALVSPM
ncbi:hypothetical protein M2159_008677 [Streptomyces sp. SAI-090]|nr:hypothetical protein [Streptomyces sp. SAI-090]